MVIRCRYEVRTAERVPVRERGDGWEAVLG
jgi:hypothetical protein